MQFIASVALLAATVSAGVLPQGGPGPVQSGGSCSADVSTTAHINLADCKAALADLRARGDHETIACDRMFRTEYNYVKKGACQVITEANGNPQCMNPKTVADGLEEILKLCTKKNTVLPGEWSYFFLGQKIRIVKA